ncbi:oxidative stress-induced growth inhibitor 1-like [Uloborus diversus]|uniref:oxidative stress-induced growth inhibitor 1-like n=1 Tax=Uloborus diversus TaxID=327109 RepID=UPI002409DD2A|nr:oxidative stress-induced growth inhibitor 1-like [Uloborus diversus]XP_054721627.1 oxidative stress-induced growth inhibitor 1-like [Uloborus diversus]
MENTFKNAVVIGNGPSGITLSYMLAGNWPYYNGLPHPIDFVQYRLQENREKSLLEQDLCYLSEGLEGRSLNPVSVMFDTLNHPEADLGVENPSVIAWNKRIENATDHIVLGKGVPGGSWQKMDGSTLTISLGSWMELPNLNIREWNMRQNRLRMGQSGLRQKRATVGTVAEYYSYYVSSQGLNKYFVNNATVTSVEPIDSTTATTLGFRNLWKVTGFTESSTNKAGYIHNKPFSYISPHVVLASGNSDQPNMLNVEGETLPFVLYSLSELENKIKEGKLSSDSGSLLIVGAGLSAADAVIASRFHGIPTYHVFRRSVSDPDLIFNKLPQNIYPEYHKVHQMMKDSNKYYEGYKAFPCSNVHSIRQDGTVIVSSCMYENEISTLKVSYVLILIGMHPNLNFLPYKDLKVGINPEKPVNCKSNPINIDLYTHESVFYPGIYAVGPLVGDNFVRFVQGGCLAVASHIVRCVETEEHRFSSVPTLLT